MIDIVDRLPGIGRPCNVTKADLDRIPARGALAPRLCRQDITGSRIIAGLRQTMPLKQRAIGDPDLPQSHHVIGAAIDRVFCNMR